MKYSPSNNSFYPAELEGAYASSGGIPGDCVKISKDVWQAYGASRPPSGMMLGPGGDGRPAWVPIPPPDLEALASRKRREIEAARDGAFTEGLPYDIAGEPDVVQTRPQDQINLLGLSSKAQRLIAGGETEAVMPFRGESNVTRLLTPKQMEEMTLAALAHIEGIYQRSWDRKDAIGQALAAEDREALESVKW